MNYECVVEYDKDYFLAKLCPAYFAKGFKMITIKRGTI
jgi:hypothetical protein